MDLRKALRLGGHKDLSIFQRDPPGDQPEIESDGGDPD
jgi:hypothetical protein